MPNFILTISADELNEIAEGIYIDFIRGRTPDVYLMLAFVFTVLTIYSRGRSDVTLKTEKRCELCLDYYPNVCQYLCKKNYITAEQKAELIQQFSQCDPLKILHSFTFLNSYLTVIKEAEPHSGCCILL